MPGCAARSDDPAVDRDHAVLRDRPASPSFARWPSTVTRPVRDEDLARAARRDAGRGEDLLESLGGHQPAAPSVGAERLR